MHRRAIAIVGCLSLTLTSGSAVLAQDEAAPVTIDALCGEAALEPVTAEVSLDADQAATLDRVLRAAVTVVEDPDLLARCWPARGGHGREQRRTRCPSPS